MGTVNVEASKNFVAKSNAKIIPNVHSSNWMGCLAAKFCAMGLL